MSARLATAAALLALVIAAPLAAQEHDAPRTPASWTVDLDAQAALREPAMGASLTPDAYWFVEMRPGWHVTMGPGGRLYGPGFEATGRYALESMLFIFPGKTGDGYGLFFGGSGTGAAARWVAALLRWDGSAAMLRHGPGVHEWIVPWAKHEALQPVTGEESVRNVLRVEVGRDSVVVRANGTRLFAVSRAAVETDGQFGFRVGREVNIHAASLDHTRHLAEVPAAR